MAVVVGRGIEVNWPGQPGTSGGCGGKLGEKGERLAADLAWPGIALAADGGFFRFIHLLLGLGPAAPGPGGRLFSVWAGARLEAYPGSQEGQKAKSTVKR